nr:hypothetical protein CFP56_13354 [Quercus suber]
MEIHENQPPCLTITFLFDSFIFCFRRHLLAPGLRTLTWIVMLLTFVRLLAFGVFPGRGLVVPCMRTDGRGRPHRHVRREPHCVASPGGQGCSDVNLSTASEEERRSEKKKTAAAAAAAAAAGPGRMAAIFLFSCRRSASSRFSAFSCDG